MYTTFFNFISDGIGNIHYINAEKRRKGFVEPDNHTYIADDWLANLSTTRINSYNYANDLTVELNVNNDSVCVELWLNDFILSNEFTAICLERVKSHGYNLRWIPAHLKTVKLCELAVNNYGNALISVPSDLTTPSMCWDAIKNDCTAFKHVPTELRTKKMCTLAVKQHGCLLCYVPEALKTLEICKLAIAQDHDALNFIPDNLKTKAMCELDDIVNNLE